MTIVVCHLVDGGGGVALRRSGAPKVEMANNKTTSTYLTNLS